MPRQSSARISPDSQDSGQEGNEPVDHARMSFKSGAFANIVKQAQEQEEMERQQEESDQDQEEEQPRTLGGL